MATYRSGENDEVSCCTSSASGFAVLCCVQDSAVFELSASLLIVCDISGGYD